MDLQYKSFAFFALAIYFFYFWHWECKSFLFSALEMQFLKNFAIGNANFFYILHWEYKSFLFFALGMRIIFIFSIDENDTILKTFLPFKCTKLTISFCNLYLPQKHPLALDFGWPKKVWKFSNFSISLGYRCLKYTYAYI